VSIGPSEPSSAPGAPRVRLLSKPGCHLCDDARGVVAQVCAELGESFEEIDILTDPRLVAQYGEQIPVAFVDGRQHDFWRVDPERLRRALLGREGGRGRRGGSSSAGSK
jgi:hypothetical protein